MEESTYDEVLSRSTDYFNGDDLAGRVFSDKYALKDVKEDKAYVYYETTPDDMHNRLADEFYKYEKKHPNPLSRDEIYNLFSHFQYIVPQGSPMAMIGNPFQIGSLSNCVVLPKLFDSYGGIMYADQQIAQLSKRRAGVGLDISPIRPKGLPTKNSSVTTDGISIFMDRFSNTIREVGQNGRRGAGIITINVHHPEVLTFTKIKNDTTRVTGANISVHLTDEFLKAVEKGIDYEVRWPVDSDNPVMKKMIDARTVWNEIIKNAHARAEPGLMFIDTIRKYHPPSSYHDFIPITSNPCSEIVMNADTCRLILLNMLSYVIDPFTDKAKFNFDLWKEHSYKAMRLADDMVDMEIDAMTRIIKKIENDPEPQYIKDVEIGTWKLYRDNAKRGRRTGTGITALGDVFAAMGITYGSDESIRLADRIFKAKKLAEYEASSDLAKERGAFPEFDWNLEKDNPFIKQILKEAPHLEEKFRKQGRRNIAISTLAPAGSVSVLTQTSSGVEPVFNLSYTRRKKVNPTDENVRVDFVDEVGDRWQEFEVVHHGVKRWMDVTGETDVEKSPYFNSTADKIDWPQRVKLQATIQKHIDHAISSTVNLPESATVEDVKAIYEAAWKSGCKGITVYRDGSRSGVLIKTEVKNGDNGSRPETIIPQSAPKRPETLVCDIHRINIRPQGKSESWVCFVSLFNGRPYEMFTGLEDEIIPPKKLNRGFITKRKVGKSSKYDLYFHKDEEGEIIYKDITSHFKNESFGAQARLISLSLRHGVPLHHIVEQLNKMENEDMFSFNKVIARVLKDYIEDGTKIYKKCPQCGSELEYKGGCPDCQSCGWTQCGSI